MPPEGLICVATANFESADNDDLLNFDLGDIIIIDFDKTNHGASTRLPWFKGYLAEDYDKWEGYFPADYVIEL